MIYLIYFCCELLGILTHLFVVKLPSLKEKATANNMKFSVAEYFKSDWIVLIGNVLCSVIVLIAWKFLVGWKPGLQKLDLGFFILIGFSGSSLVLAGFSRFNSVIIQAINVNANLAQGIQPPVNPSNEEGADKIIKDATKPSTE